VVDADMAVKIIDDQPAQDGYFRAAISNTVQQDLN